MPKKAKSGMIVFMTWYGLALVALVLYGFQNFLYKVSAEKKCNAAWVMVAFATTTGILGTVFFFLSGETVVDISLLFWISFIGSATFLISRISRMEALKNVSSSVVYPIGRLSTVLVVLFALFYFRESLSLFQAVGVGLAVVVLLLLTKQSHQERAKHPNFRLGIILAIAALFSAAGATIITKFAAISFENFFAFIALSGIFTVIFAFGLTNKLQSGRENVNHRNAILIGCIAGLLNFIGFYVLLQALAIGPLSIIAAIHSMNFGIAILLAVLIYKEELTKRRLAGIGLTVLALILLRIS